MKISAKPAPVGEKIRVAREALALTQDEIAAKLGIKGASVSRWEKDRSYPSGRYLVAIGDVLNLPPNWWGAPSTSHEAVTPHAPAARVVTQQDLLLRARRLAERFRERLLAYVRSEHVAMEDKIIVVDVLWPAQVDVVTRPAFPSKVPEKEAETDPALEQRTARRSGGTASRTKRARAS